MGLPETACRRSLFCRINQEGIMGRREYAKSAEHLEALEVRGDLAVRLADALLAGNELRAGELLTSYKQATEHLRELSEMDVNG